MRFGLSSSSPTIGAEIALRAKILSSPIVAYTRDVRRYIASHLLQILSLGKSFKTLLFSRGSVSLSGGCLARHCVISGTLVLDIPSHVALSLEVI